MDPVRDESTESTVVKKDEAESAEEMATTTTGPEETPRAKEPEKSALADGLIHIKALYEDCNKKINKRINKLLRTNMEAKSSAEKDLFQIKEYILSLYRCLKVSGFRYLDEVLTGDVIPVSDYVDFVREKRDLQEATVVNVIPTVLNGKLSFSNQNQTVSGYVSGILRSNWSDLVWERLARLLRSHSLKIRIDEAAIAEGKKNV